MYFWGQRSTLLSVGVVWSTGPRATRSVDTNEHGTVGTGGRQPGPVRGGWLNGASIWEPTGRDHLIPDGDRGGVRDAAEPDDGRGPSSGRMPVAGPALGSRWGHGLGHADSASKIV